MKNNKLFDHILKVVFCFEKKNIVIVHFVKIFFKSFLYYFEKYYNTILFLYFFLTWHQEIKFNIFKYIIGTFEIFICIKINKKNIVKFKIQYTY